MKKFGLLAPETLTMAITGECNLRCRHCWVNAGVSTSASAVPLAKVRRIIEEFAAQGGLAVRLTGGEPLLHPHWLELVAVADAVGLKVLLQTNGMLFTPATLGALQALAVQSLSIQISLDGASALTHDLVRGSGAFAQVLNGVMQLIAHGFGTVVTFFLTEMRHNMHELPDLFKLASDLGIGSVSSGALVQCGRGRVSDVIAPPQPEQYCALLQRYVDDPSFKTLYDNIGTVAALEWYSNPQAPQRCDLVRTPYLTANGRLYSCLMCHADDYSVADVYDKPLAVAFAEGALCWQQLQKLSTERALLISQCRNCALHDSCAGGCLGRTWGSFGSFLVPEDRCELRRAVLNWTKKS